MRLWQPPNLLIKTAAVAAAVDFLVDGLMGDIAHLVFLMALGLWALQEALAGSSVGRKLLGAIVLLGVIFYGL